MGKNLGQKPLIGFIGQGFIGKSYADDMERRGHATVRYALEEPYKNNKESIKECEIVFIAVPTPTTPKGFDYSIVEGALRLVGKGKTAVIKSTILPGTTARLQKKFPQIFVMHSPEFLVLKQAAEDAARPLRNIIGIPKKSKAFEERAKAVLQVLPRAPFEIICSAPEAEMVKYAGNFFLYLKVLYANLMYETADAIGADYEVVRKAIAADPRIGASHLQVAHDSGHKGAKVGRGAGGVCFIKDVQALADFYADTVGDTYGEQLFAAATEKNLDLLVKSNKDIDLVVGVHGQSAVKCHTKNK
jgi:nucleotide sugar dehydrogenase